MKVPLSARGGQLLKIYPDGSKEVLKEYDPNKLIVLLDGDRVYKIYEHRHHQAVKS